MTWQTQCWWCSNALLVAMLGAGNHPGMNYRLWVIIGQAIRRGNVPCSVCQRGVVDIRVVYPYSLYFSEQLSCIKFFHLTYGLKDIDFQSFIQFKRISGFLLLINQHYPKQYWLTGSTDRWGPAISFDQSTNTILDNVNIK